MGEHAGVGDMADGTVEHAAKYTKIEVEVSEKFKIPFITFINSLKELTMVVRSWRERS